MTKEIKIEKVDNGYIVKLMNYSGGTMIFSKFAEAMDWLLDYFDEKAVLKQ